MCGRRDLVARLAGTMSRVWVADIGEGRRWLSAGLEAVDELEAEHRVRTLAVAAQVAVLAMEAGDGARPSGGRRLRWHVEPVVGLAHALCA